MHKLFIIGDNNLNRELKLFFSKFVFSDNLSDADFIFETTLSSKIKKAENLKTIEENSQNNSPVISNSLCITVSEQISFSKNPDRLIGVGIYPGFSTNNFLEITYSKKTAQVVRKKMNDLLKSVPIGFSIVPDAPGLVFPRIISMIINEAAQVYSEKIASKEDIDTAMKLGTNYPHGPLEWADIIGIPNVFEILSALQRFYGEDRYRPHPLLRQMKELGEKFYV